MGARFYGHFDIHASDILHENTSALKICDLNLSLNRDSSKIFRLFSRPLVMMIFVFWRAKHVAD